MVSVHQSTTIRALKPDFRNPSWRRALAHALEVYPPDPAVEWEGENVPFVVWEGEAYESALLVRCAGSCQGRQPWHRVDWTADGLTCDCPSRHPCRHRARAWCEYMGEWRRLKAIAREHGVEAAVRWLVYDQTGELDVTPIRPLRDVRLWRENGIARADIPHYHRHSEGFEWGYSGSGPADLAYSVLTYFYGPAVGQEFYQSFKREVIASIPHDAQEYLLAADEIAHWVEQARYRPCPGPWTAFADGSAPLCSCHAVPDAWIDEAYPTYDIEPGTPCGSVSCVCRYAEEE